MILFECTVLGKPVPQGRARVPRFGKAYYPKTSRAYRKVLSEAFMGIPKGTRAISLPCAVNIQACGLRANADLDNLAKMVLDALQDAGVLASDDCRTVRELSLRMVDGDPRLIVTISALTE